MSKIPNRPLPLRSAADADDADGPAETHNLHTRPQTPDRSWRWRWALTPPRIVPGSDTCRTAPKPDECQPAYTSNGRGAPRTPLPDVPRAARAKETSAAPDRLSYRPITLSELLQNLFQTVDRAETDLDDCRKWPVSPSWAEIHKAAVAGPQPTADARYRYASLN